MPPKKKKGKKSGKKKSAQKSQGENSKINDVFNEVTKEFYIIQIRDLEGKIARYQELCDKLELRNKDIESKFDQQSTDKKEIVNFLKKQLKERSDEIADLQEKFIALQQTKEIAQEKYEVEIAGMKLQMQELKDQLTSENMVLGAKLASLEEFRLQKEDLLNKFAEMEELLKSQSQNHKEQIYQLERKAVVDKDRLKKEMILRVNTVAAEFRKVSNKQMSDTTKRTIRENVSINSQLLKMSDKTMELLLENDEMKSKEKKNRQNIDLLEDNEKELMKKNTTNQKVIRMLGEKLKQQEVSFKEQEEKLIYYAKIENEFEDVKFEINQLKEELLTSNFKQKQLVGEVKSFSKENMKLSNDKDYLVGILSDATSVIKHALQHNSQSSDESIVEMKNTNLLYKVIDILNLAVEMGVGIDLPDLASNRVKAWKFNSDSNHDIVVSKLGKSASPASNSRPSSKSSSVRKHTHYQLGDLGIVPSLNQSTGEKKKKKSPRKDNINIRSYSSNEQIAPIRSDNKVVTEDNTIKLPLLNSPVNAT